MAVIDHRLGTFFGTRRELEVLKRQSRGEMSKLPRYRSLSMDAKLFVDRGGTVHYRTPEGHSVVVAQCIPLQE